MGKGKNREVEQGEEMCKERPDMECGVREGDVWVFHQR